MAADVTDLLAARLRDLRSRSGLSLDALAQRSGVSRSNISLIERGASSPSAVVLDKLATALGVSVASLFESPARAEAPSPLLRVADQPVWSDPASGSGAATSRRRGSRRCNWWTWCSRPGRRCALKPPSGAARSTNWSG